jgi:serine/threonine-protein kinase SRPK3
VSLDLHLRNVLVRLPSTFEELSVEEFREKFGEPEMVPIARVDEKPLTPNVPARAVVPLFLGKKAQEFTLDDAHGLILSDFGEAFSPATERRLGRNCNIPLAKRAPEAFFEPDEPLSYPSDIWSLGTAIWEILGMKFIFSESETQDEIVAEQIDVLGYHNFPKSWRNQWERLGKEEDSENSVIPRQPTGDRETWPSLEDAFEEFVQKYRRRQEAAGTFEEKETQAILDLMRSMLKFRPGERLTIDEVLKSEWMVDWALPQLGQGPYAII